MEQAAWSGGTRASPLGALNEAERKRDLEACQDRLEKLAEHYAVVANGSKMPELEEPPDPDEVRKATSALANG